MEYKEKRKINRGRKFLSFFICGEEYCISIDFVKEIMGLPDITRLPQTPEFIIGVINLRGTIMPVIDLRKKLELPWEEYGPLTCIIVIEFEFEGAQTKMAIIVDETNEVVAIPDELISHIPYVNSKIKSEYIEGIAEMENRIKIVLDISKVLKDEEFVIINELNRKSPAEKEHIDE